MSHVTRNIHVQISVWTCFQFPCRYIYKLRMELLGHSNSMFNTWEIPRLFYKAAPSFYNPATSIEGCTCSTPLPTLDMVSLLGDTVIPVGVKLAAQWGFDLYFPNDKWFLSIFHVLVGQLSTLFGELSTQILIHFKTGLSFV